MGVGSTYNHNCLSFKAKVGKKTSTLLASGKRDADIGLKGSNSW